MAEGAWLGASRNVHAMMDTSDGLSTDLRRMANASQLRARIEHLPIAEQTRRVAERCGDDPERYALDGGEDFELLVAIDGRAFRYLAGRFAARFGRPLIRAGTFVAGTGVVAVSGSSERPVAPGGFDHFDATAGA